MVKNYWKETKILKTEHTVALNSDPNENKEIG